jgi:hypothetical protein
VLWIYIVVGCVYIGTYVLFGSRHVWSACSRLVVRVGGYGH